MTIKIQTSRKKGKRFQYEVQDEQIQKVNKHRKAPELASRQGNIG